MTIEPQPATPTVPLQPQIPLEPQVIEITGAEVTLEVVFPACEDDDLFVVPAFLLLPEDTVGLSVSAVAEASLDVPDPEAEQEPCPGDPAVDTPVGKPEPAPLPADTGREPAGP
jgi:hypothetical protein